MTISNTVARAGAASFRGVVTKAATRPEQAIGRAAGNTVRRAATQIAHLPRPKIAAPRLVCRYQPDILNRMPVVAASHAAVETPNGAIKLANMNLQRMVRGEHTVAEVQRTMDTVRKLNATVLVVQEVGPGPMLADLNRDFLGDMGYKHLAVMPGNNDMTMGVLSKLPLVSVTPHRLTFRVPGQPNPQSSLRGLLEVVVETAPGDAAKKIPPTTMTLFSTHCKASYPGPREKLKRLVLTEHWDRLKRLGRSPVPPTTDQLERGIKAAAFQRFKASEIQRGGELSSLHAFFTEFERKQPNTAYAILLDANEKAASPNMRLLRGELDGRALLYDPLIDELPGVATHHGGKNVPRPAHILLSQRLKNWFIKGTSLIMGPPRPGLLTGEAAQRAIGTKAMLGTDHSPMMVALALPKAP